MYLILISTVAKAKPPIQNLYICNLKTFETVRFDNDDLFQVVNGDRPEIPVELSEPAQNFMRKCFEREPSERPVASQLLRLLSRSSNHGGNREWTFRYRIVVMHA